MKINRERILILFNNVLHKPLFYLLPLLAVLYLVFIPAKMEFSDIKVTRNDKTEDIKLPYSADMAGGEYFIISYNLSVKNKKNAKFKVIPDDCIQEIVINGENAPLDGVQGLCDYSSGVNLDFSEYVKEGLNHFEIRVSNGGGYGGLRIEIPVEIPYEVFGQLSLIQHIFVLLFMFSIVLVLKKLHNLKLNLETIFACILAFPFVIYAFVELCIRINYELTGVYSCDTTIYWAVGRGILNGIAPWSGLFETKPPGIFLLSAISFKFFDSSIFTNYFQVFVLILTAAVPTAAYFLISNYRSISKFALSLLAGLLLALYSATRSGEVQAESFGAAFACIAVFAMAMPNFEKRKILWVSLATIGMLGACGFKEPFLFPLFGVSLILCKNIKEWAWRFALPLAIAVLLGVVFLLVCGWLDDYLHYLEYMSSTHISRYAPPFRRAMEFHRLYDDMNAFSWGLAIAVLALLSLPFVTSKSNENTFFIKVIFFGIAFFLSSYSVGIGGDFFWHHFIFALPFYMALFLFLLKNWNEENFAVGKLGLFSFIFLAIAALNLPIPNFDLYSKNLNNMREENEQAAAYLDKKMDELGIDRYVFIGGHDYVAEIFGWTRHSPMGPYFNQQRIWFELLDVGDSLISYLKKADAVVIGTMGPEFKPIAGNIYDILNEQFTKEQVNRFPMYFRKNETREDNQK